METMISPSYNKRISTRLFKELNLPDRIADKERGNCIKEAAAHCCLTVSPSLSFPKGKKFYSFNQGFS